MGRGLSTTSIHGHGHDDSLGAHIPPVYLSVIYEYIDYELGLAVFNDRGKYVRYGREENPTTRALERVVAKLEETQDSLAFNSGMSAISTMLIWSLEPGDKIVIPMEIYSSTIALLNNIAPKMGVKVIRVWPSAEAIVDAVDEETKLVFLEVLTNPTVKVIDIKYLYEHLDLEKLVLVVDNTFTTPVVVKPARYGAKMVVHSMTKYLGGHNDVVGGVIATDKDSVSVLWEWRRMLGGILQPFEAYMILRGIKTLELRYERHSSNAKAVAEYLADHSRVDEVMYPGLPENNYHDIAKSIFDKPLFGGVLSFRLKGDYDDAVRFLKKLRLIKRSPSLGGPETMAIVPVKSAAMFIPPEDRAKLGITDNLIRLSIGLEDPEDLIEDLSRALT